MDQLEDGYGDVIIRSNWFQGLDSEVKTFNGTSKVKELPHYRHGSPDSLDAGYSFSYFLSDDLDVYYEFPCMPPAKECFLFMSGTEEDRNIIIIEDGLIKVLSIHHVTYGWRIATKETMMNAIILCFVLMDFISKGSNSL